MENEIVLLDTSILIDYFRKTNKSNSVLYQLTLSFEQLAISSITEFEIYVGSTPSQKEFWTKLFQEIKIYNFDSETAQVAAELNISLKKTRNQIAIPDLFIAATALKNNISLATLNLKHFVRIQNLSLINLDNSTK